MKKGILVPLLAAAGVAAYYVSKKLKTKDDYEEVMFVEINDEDDENDDKEYGQTIQEIQKMYPELSLNFINSTFEQNDKFNEEYVGNVKVEHNVRFEDENDRNIFVDVCKDNEYNVEVNGDVKVISMFTNEKGSIMSDIFNVANQTALLNGQYLGYKIEVEK